jgi:hypothetical protein
MLRNPTIHRMTLAALAATALTLTLAPAALADPGSRRWKHDGPRYVGATRRVVVLRERDRFDGGSALAGFIGGMVIGAALSHPHPVVVHECAPPPPVYRYEDAWSSRWWDSIDGCRDAAYDRHGPRVIRVVNVHSGACVRTLYWKHDHFVADDDRDADWDD